MNVGSILKKARESKKMTLRAVEAKTSINNSHISQIESGKIKNPSFSTVMTLAKVYGLKVSDLMEEK